MRFLIRDDEVQVDKAIKSLADRIEILSATNKTLAQENKQLKNRPDTVYDPPKQGLVVKCTKGGKINMDAPIKDWNAHHFLRLFQNLYKAKYSQDFAIRGKQWAAYAIRISQFRNAHEAIQDNAVYKEMIEWLFAKKFNKRFIATIALVASDTMFYQWATATKSQGQTDLEKFKQRAAQTPKSTADLAKALAEAFK